MQTCYCSCGWPVRTSVSVEIDCPQCGSTIKCNLPWQLGDWLEYCLAFVGGNWYKRIHLKLTGKQCGCKKRKAWLNRLGEKIAARFRRA